MNIYAVIQNGGKQYRIAPGDVIRVEKLAAAPGETVEIDRVYMLVNGQDVHMGRPVLAGARIRAEVLEEGRGEKLIIFKARRRKGYRKTSGHRQYFTALRISEILFNDAVFRAPENPPKQAQKTNSAVAAPVLAKKEGLGKENTVKKKPERQSAPVVKEDKVVSAKTEPLLPAKQPTADSRPTIAPSSADGAPSGGAGGNAAVVQKKLARAEEREDPSETLVLPVEKKSPALPTKTEELPSPSVRSEDPGKTLEKPTEKIAAPARRRTVISIAAALLLLALVLLLWDKIPFSGSLSTLVPMPTTVQPADQGLKKANVPVPEKAIADTTPVNKPSAPAQPPD